MAMAIRLWRLDHGWRRGCDSGGRGGGGRGGVGAVVMRGGWQQGL